MGILLGICLAWLLFGSPAQKLRQWTRTIGVKEISWNHLLGLNIQNGSMTEDLRSLNTKLVRLPGFIVPLVDSLAQFEEFLLVPDAMACIHAPPPPPNQMVYVKLKKPVNLDQTFGPVWVQGALQISTQGTLYGNSSFEIKEAEIEPYKLEF